MKEKAKIAVIKRKRRLRIIILFLIIILMLFVPFWYFLGSWAKQHGFEGAGDFVRTVTVNYWSSLDADYETIEITISESDFNKLEVQRENHLKRGIITKSNDRYVPAVISYNGKKIKCRVRLKGHMTDHLQNKKWSFRVQTKGNDFFKGMKIFSLQHPGTRNYIYEWIYHQMLTEEDIASVRYSFLNVKVNGESWGIYALEENFGEELIDYRKLPDGPILGFNPDMYWNARLNHHDKLNVDLSDLEGWSAYPEAYEEDEWMKSKVKKADYAQAFSLLQNFRTGKLKTSEVFDIEKLAKFHAIIDLVGGHSSLDWSDVKYYFNPVTQLIEPLGYESFSVQNTAKLGGEGRFRNNAGQESTLHTLLFSDPVFFEKYIFHLKRISEKKYLDHFFDKYESAIEENLKILYTEFPYKKLPLGPYYKNQKNIKALLNVPVTNAVFIEDYKNDTLFLNAGITSRMPVTINKIYYKDSVINLDKNIYFSSKTHTEHVIFETIKIPVKGISEKEKISLLGEIPGSGKPVEIKVKSFSPNEESDFNFNTVNQLNYRKLSFLSIDDMHKEIVFNQGEIEINETVVFPEDYSVIINSGTELNLLNSSLMVVRGNIQISGTEEIPVNIFSGDSTGKGILLLNSMKESKIKFTQFSDLNSKSGKGESYRSAVQIYRSRINFINCVFSSGAVYAIHAFRSVVTVSGTVFSGFKNSAVFASFGKVYLTKCEFLNNITSIDINSVIGNFKNIKIKNSGDGVKADNASDVKGDNWLIENVNIAVTSADMSKCILSKVKIVNAKIGFIAEKKSNRFGAAVIEVQHYSSANVKQKVKSDQKSKIIFK